MGKREDRLRKALPGFVQQYGRRGGPSLHDRGYDRKVEEQLKRLSAEELDRLLREDDEDESAG